MSLFSRWYLCLQNRRRVCLRSRVGSDVASLIPSWRTIVSNPCLNCKRFLYICLPSFHFSFCLLLSFLLIFSLFKDGPFLSFLSPLLYFDSAGSGRRARYCRPFFDLLFGSISIVSSLDNLSIHHPPLVDTTFDEDDDDYDVPIFSSHLHPTHLTLLLYRPSFLFDLRSSRPTDRTTSSLYL